MLDYCNTIKPIPVGAAKRRIFVETFFFAVPPCHIWFDSFSFVIIKRATFLIWPKGKCKYIYPCFSIGGFGITIFSFRTKSRFLMKQNVSNASIALQFVRSARCRFSAKTRKSLKFQEKTLTRTKF